MGVSAGKDLSALKSYEISQDTKNPLESPEIHKNPLESPEIYKNPLESLQPAPLLPPPPWGEHSYGFLRI